MLLLQLAAWLLVFALETSATPAVAPPKAVVEIDRVRLDESDGRLTLCAIVDEPLDSRAAIDRLNRKLRGYARHARSAELFARHRGADPRLLPRLAVIVARPTSRVERQNLRGVALQYRYAAITLAIEGIDGDSS